MPLNKNNKNLEGSKEIQKESPSIEMVLESTSHVTRSGIIQLKVELMMDRKETILIIMMVKMV